MRSHYWTCSKFADWLRGTAKPRAETSKGWRDWKKAAKKSHPIRFWLADDGLDYIQKVVYYVPDQLYSLKYYINNRWVTRTHSLTAHSRDIKPGTWCDVGNRFLPCLFNELVDFVEVEQAWSHIAWGNAEDRAKYEAPFWSTGWFRWRTWRSAQAGLDHLDWASKLVFDENMGVYPGNEHFGKPTGQAEDAKEIYALYHWWTKVRPARPDPYDASGWSKYCNERRAARKAEGDDDVLSFLDDEKTDEERATSRSNLDLLQEIETAYDNEDTEMMIRLIKIRRGLWT